MITTQLACASADVLQHLGLARIAVHHRVAGLPADADAVGIQIERDVLEAGLLEHARDVLAHAAEAADHDVIALGDRERAPAPRASPRFAADPIRPAARA